jgi:hypothetical protein
MGKCTLCRRMRELVNAKVCKECDDLIKGED